MNVAFICWIFNKYELEGIAYSHWAGFNWKYFRNFYNHYAKDSYTFKASDTTLPFHESFFFGKNLTLLVI